jgi:heterotetrameric sarcosine oxidase gamma subunit
MLVARSALGTPLGTSTPIERLSRPGLEVIERGDMGCVLCTAAVDASYVLARISSALEVDLPAESGLVAHGGERSAIWLSPRSWLILCPLDEEWDLAASINQAFSDRRVLASVFADYLCWIELSGKAVEDTLRQGGFISLASGGLPEGHAKRTMIAGISIIVHRNTATDWTLGVERSRAQYFTDWLLSACPFHLIDPEGFSVLTDFI